MQYAQPVTKKGAKKETAADASEEEKKKLSNHAQRHLDERKKGACVKCHVRYGAPHADIYPICLSSAVSFST